MTLLQCFRYRNFRSQLHHQVHKYPLPENININYIIMFVVLDDQKFPFFRNLIYMRILLDLRQVLCDT